MDFHEACFFSYGFDHQESMVHIERYLRDSIENEKNLTWNRLTLELIQEIIHENNLAGAEGIKEEKIAGFEARYDDIVRTSAKEYEDDPPSDYYKDGYNLYLRMVKYKHHHLLFLSNPLVAPDNNLCERKAWVLKGKFNQAISLRSFENLTYFCECLSVVDHFAAKNADSLYESVKNHDHPSMNCTPNVGHENKIMYNIGGAYFYVKNKIWKTLSKEPDCRGNQ